MVLESVIYGLVAALGFGCGDLLVTIISRRLGILRTAIGAHLVTFVISTPYLLYLLISANLSKVTLADWGALAGISILSVLVLLLFYRALQVGPLSIVSPVISAYAVITVPLAVIFAGERLSSGQSIGIVATIGGVALASLNLREFSSGNRLIGTGVLLGLITSVGLGVMVYAVGVVSQDLGWFIPAYALNVMTLGMLAPAGFLRRELPWQNLTRSLAGGIFLMGTIDTVAFFAFTRGTEVGIISIVAAAAAAHPIVPVVVGVLILRERLAINQVAGLAILIAGVLVLSLSP